MPKKEIARELFTQGANCAQSVLIPFAEECKLDKETACCLASGFGGGMGRLRQVCGAVSAMFIIANLQYGPRTFGDKKLKDEQYARIQDLAKRFQDRVGTIICGEILDRHQKESAVSEERTEKYYKERPCGHVVEIAAEIIEEYLAEHGKL